MIDPNLQKVSTSALAKTLEVPSQQLFSTLKDYGWIRKLEEGWGLTSKGEFEGGEYVHSKRYGRYIVWPEVLADHPLLQALEDNRYIAATAIGKSVGINPREVNRILAELGWLKHGFQGWELTALGEERGGIQLENESSGTFYVVWPQNVQGDRVLEAQLGFAAEITSERSVECGDLFAEQSDYQGVDGHLHQNKVHLQICHWLYMAGQVHACKRRLPVDEDLFADFYLPSHHLYIEVWNDDTSAALSKRMRRREIYKKWSFAVIDIEKTDVGHLDDVLTRQFRKHGIRVY
jgi:hypothetical protein|tara:strand:- start:6827 stop:7699 length:873 start_codon:yes stop_codon:yes gene_type:complete